LCKEAQPLFNATAAHASDFSGQSATWATVINKRAADGCNSTDVLKILLSTFHTTGYLLRGNKEATEKRKKKNIKKKGKVNSIL
jgi:hypothetical protein